MPPRVFRKLLTAIHLLVLLSFVMQPVSPLVATAATLAAKDARPLEQEEQPTEEEIPVIEPEEDEPYDPEIPAPIIPIPESDNPFEPPTSPVEIPKDGLWADGETPDPGPSPDLLGTTTLPATPINLTLEADRYLLIAGEQATLSLGIFGTSEPLSSTVAVTLTLPPQLKFVGDPAPNKVWSFGAEELAIGVNQTYTVEVSEAFTQSQSVVEIWLETSAPGYEA